VSPEIKRPEWARERRVVRASRDLHNSLGPMPISAVSIVMRLPDIVVRRGLRASIGLKAAAVEAEEQLREPPAEVVEAPVVRHSVAEVAGVEVEASHGGAAGPVVVVVDEAAAVDGDRKSNRIVALIEDRFVTGLEPTD
jgi:hypothetical protein